MTNANTLTFINGNDSDYEGTWKGLDLRVYFKESENTYEIALYNEEGDDVFLEEDELLEIANLFDLDNMLATLVEIYEDQQEQIAMEREENEEYEERLASSAHAA